MLQQGVEQRGDSLVLRGGDGHDLCIGQPVEEERAREKLL
jgi:hypothetical protein